MIDSVVVLVLFVAAIACVPFALRHRRSGTGESVRVAARTALAKGVVVAVITVDERRLVVGTGESGVQLLAELDGDGQHRAGAGAGGPRSAAAITAPDTTSATTTTGLGGMDAAGPLPVSTNGGDVVAALASGVSFEGQHTGPGIGLVDRLRAMTVRTPAAGRPIRDQPDR